MGKWSDRPAELSRVTGLVRAWTEIQTLLPHCNLFAWLHNLFLIRSPLQNIEESLHGIMMCLSYSPRFIILILRSPCIRKRNYEFPRGNNVCIISHHFFKSKASNKVEGKHSGSYGDAQWGYRLLSLCLSRQRSGQLQVRVSLQLWSRHEWSKGVRLLVTNTSKNN